MINRVSISRLRDFFSPDTPLWIRSLLSIGLFLFNIALLFMAVQRQVVLFIYLLVGVCLVVAFLRWPPLGLIVASLAGAVVPFLGPSGLNITMILVVLLLSAWMLDMIVHRRQIRLLPSRTVWPLFAFLSVALFSFGVGQLPWINFAQNAPLGAQLGGLSIIVLSAGTYLLAANHLHEMVWLRRMTWAFLAIAGLLLFFRSVLPELGLSTRNLFQPMGSVFFIWMVAIAFSQAAYNRELHSKWRWALGGLVLVTLYVLFFLKYADKSGWIPALICIAAMIGFRSWRAWLVVIPVAGLSVFYLLTGGLGVDEYSLTTRFDAWSIMFQIIKINPIWGVGFANYYWYTPLFPIRGYSVSFNSHNNYVDIVAQTGLVGLVFFLLFLWEVGRLGWRLRDDMSSGFTQAYVIGALGGLVGMVVAGMLGDWILPFFYNIGLNGFRSSMLGWLFLGGLVSLEQMKKSRQI